MFFATTAGIFLCVKVTEFRIELETSIRMIDKNNMKERLF